MTVKRAFFKRDAIAGDTFDYLEEKRHLEVTTIVLINKVAKRAFGESFRDYSESSFSNIDYLFQCRNKIAHRAQAVYRDGKGVQQTVDTSTIEAWWYSVSELFEWLETKARKCGE